MTRKQAAKILNAATAQAVILPEGKAVSIETVRTIASIEGTRCRMQADGSLYVQGAYSGYEVRA